MGNRRYTHTHTHYNIQIHMSTQMKRIKIYINFHLVRDQLFNLFTEGSLRQIKIEKSTTLFKLTVFARTKIEGTLLANVSISILNYV